MSIAELTKRWPVLDGEAIPYAEAIVGPASPEEEFRDDGSRAIRTFYCLWDDRFRMRDALLGYPSVFTANGSRYISRAVPDHHPECLDPNGKPFLFATQVMRCEPWGFPDPEADGKRKMINRSSKIARYGLAKMQVLYETLPWEVMTDDKLPLDDKGNPDEASLYRNVVIMPTPAGQAIPIPTQTMKWVDGDVVTKNAVSNYVSKTEIVDDIIIRWMRVPRNAVGINTLGYPHPSYPIDEAKGKINSKTFGGCPPGTLLLETAIPTPVRSSVGLRLYDIEFHFKYFSPTVTRLPANKPVTHSHLLRKLPTDTVARYIEVVFDDAGPPVPSNLDTQAAGKSLHDWFDFNLCFRVPR